MDFTVGYREGMIDDPERPAWRTDTPRPLAWAAWYPGSPDASAQDLLFGPPGGEIFRLGVAAKDAAMNQTRERWPVVLLSHGTGGTAQGLAWLGQHLATKGFIALGVSHHGNTAGEAYLPEGFMCWWERARDLTTILDWAVDDGPFAGRVDLTNVFAAGFSLGGYTVLALAGAVSELARFQSWLESKGAAAGGPREFPNLADHIPKLLEESAKFRQSMARHNDCHRDHRVRAVAVFAPAPPVRAFTPDSLAAISLPIHIMVGKGDVDAPYDECALWLQQHNPSFEVSLLGDEIGHYVFLPEATETGRAQLPDICCDPPGVDRRTVHRDAAATAERLFSGAIDLPP